MPTHIRFDEAGAICSATASNPTFVNNPHLSTHTRFYDGPTGQPERHSSRTRNIQNSAPLSHIRFPDLDAALRPHELPLAREYLLRMREEVRDEMVGYEAWQRLPKGSPHDAEDLAAFMRQHPRYADPATHPPTLRPFAAECLSRRDHTGQSRIMLLDRSIVSPRSVREGVLDVDLRETYVTPPALAARDYDPTKPRQERGDSVTSDAATDGTVPGRRFWVENETVQPVKSGGSRQKIPDWKLLPWEISARGWTEETHVDLGSLKEYSEIYTILREDRFGFGIRRLAILFEPLLGFNVRDLVSSSHPVNGRDVYVMEPLYLAKFFDLNRPTIESDRDAPEILLTKRAKEYSHPYDVSLLRERIRRVVVQEIHRLLRTLIEEFVAGTCGGNVVQRREHMNLTDKSRRRGITISLDSLKDCSGDFPEPGALVVEISELKGFLQGSMPWAEDRVIDVEMVKQEPV